MVSEARETGLIGNRKMQRSELRVITCLLLTEIQRHGCDGGAMGIGWVAETVLDLDSDINTLCILSSSSYTYFYSTLFFYLFFIYFAQC